MTETLILASGSETRARLLREAGVAFEQRVPRLDEGEIRRALLAEGARPRDVADVLAEQKARRVTAPEGTLVLGSDQVLEHRGRVLGKAESPEEVRRQLGELRGERHALLSAAVLYEAGRPVWRHVGVARLQMREVSDGYLDDYVARNWETIRHSVGGYRIEAEGVRLFARIEGDFFTILGLPLLELLSYLALRGTIPG